jgi:hypothetical protein
LELTLTDLGGERQGFGWSFGCLFGGLVKGIFEEIWEDLLWESDALSLVMFVNGGWMGNNGLTLHREGLVATYSLDLLVSWSWALRFRALWGQLGK